jgi:hypothetical protein
MAKPKYVLPMIVRLVAPPPGLKEGNTVTLTQVTCTIVKSFVSQQMITPMPSS